MMENLQPKIKIVDVGEPMGLYKTLKGEKTSPKWLIDNYTLYLFQNGYARNTCITYVKQAKLLLRENPNEKDRKKHRYHQKISSIQIEKYLMGKSNISFSATKVFLKYLYFQFKKKFIHIDFPRIKPEEKKVIVTLSEEEINEVILALPLEYRFFTKFLFICGLRISEIYRLKVSSIDWAKWKEDRESYAFLKVTKAKGRKERRIPIRPSFVLEVHNFVKKRSIEIAKLKARKKRIDLTEEDLRGKVLPEALLFDFNDRLYLYRRKKIIRKKRTGYFLNLNEKNLEKFQEDLLWHKLITKNTRHFEKLFREASFETFKVYHHPHVLRASRATQLLKAGMPLIKVRDFLGHSTVKTTERYLSTTEEELSSDMKERGL